MDRCHFEAFPQLQRVASLKILARPFNAGTRSVNDLRRVSDARVPVRFARRYATLVDTATRNPTLKDRAKIDSMLRVDVDT